MDEIEPDNQVRALADSAHRSVSYEQLVSELPLEIIGDLLEHPTPLRRPTICVSGGILRYFIPRRATD